MSTLFRSQGRGMTIFPCYFPDNQGIGGEPGSHCTAATATQSRLFADLQFATGAIAYSLGH